MQEEREREEVASSPEKDMPEGAPSEAGEAVATLGIEELRSRLEKAEEEIKELRDKWMRARADLANYRRRAEQEREEVRKFSTVRLLSRIVPVLDDLDRAFLTVPRELAGFTWIDGLLFTQRKLLAVLEAEGVKEIVTEGVNFDPQLHEAVFYQETTEHGEGYILAELQKGYLLYDRILRPALVKVAKAAPASPPGPEEAEEGEARPEAERGGAEGQPPKEN